LAAELGYPNAFQAGMLVCGPSDTPLAEALHRQILDQAPREIDELNSALGP
jgi:hypothetical protein